MMNTTTRTAIACIAVACAAVAATPKAQKRLTPRQLFELTAPSGKAAHPKIYKVEISDLGSASLPAAKPEGEIQSIREFRFPTEFEPPEAAANGAPVITPLTPTAFETVNTGWTIRLTAKPAGRIGKPAGKLVALYGVADFVAAELVRGGYGAIAGPIYTEQGEVITLNKLDQPKFQTTTTRFHIFALPGEPYAITLYRGAKAEKHIVTVTTE